MQTGKIPHSFSVIFKGVEPISAQAIAWAVVFRTRPPLTLCAHTDHYTAIFISGPLTHSKYGISGRVLLAYTLMCPDQVRSLRHLWVF